MKNSAFRLALLLLLATTGCMPASEFICLPSTVDTTGLRNNTTVDYNPSLVRQREIIFAIRDNSPHMSKFYSHGLDGMDPMYPHTMELMGSHSIVEFDTLCWTVDVHHGFDYSYSTALLRIPNSPDGDSVQEMMKAAQSTLGRLYVWPYSNEWKEWGIPDTNYNVITVSDPGFASIEPLFDHFIFRLYSAKIWYIDAGQGLQVQWNFNRYYQDCGPLVIVPVQRMVVTKVENAKPYRPSRPPCISFRSR